MHFTTKKVLLRRDEKIMNKIAVKITTVNFVTAVVKETMTAKETMTVEETTIVSAIMIASVEGGTVREKAGARGHALAQEAEKDVEVKRGQIRHLALLLRIGENSDKLKR